RNEIDPKERITEYYRMPKVIADDLENLLPSLVEPQSWKLDANPAGFGSIVKVASTPTVSSEPVVTLDYSVLIIYQSREIHEKISDLIVKIEHGNNGKDGGMGNGMGGGMGGGGSRGRGGSFGGGLFFLQDDHANASREKLQK
ncbi:MAG: hypothetical protein VX438_08035, partial [Planctomycetota bacterium]|nr:hypothetical protein [Planctomycetota bacterium]